MAKPRKASLVIIVQGGNILLGRKVGKPEIGVGTLNGPGGKFESGIDETMEDCAVRETKEELGVDLDRAHMRKTNIVTFFTGFVTPKPLHEVHVFHAPAFTGAPGETESMIPELHPIDTIPYDRMLAADRYWFPKALAGESFNLDVYYETFPPTKDSEVRFGAFRPFLDNE